MNPHAAAFFITRFCRTLDEDSGTVSHIPDWPFVLELIDFLEGCRTGQVNGLVDKSRRMLVTWTVCAWFRWRMQFTTPFPAFMTSGRGQEYVDDGGENSTPKSLFGRLRFIHDRLPPFLSLPVSFAFKRATAPLTNSYITGEAPTEQAGRGGGFQAALVDESAFLPFSESFHRAIDPACRSGRIYTSSPNGPANVHARIIKSKPPGWRIHVVDWRSHPRLNQGLEPTPEHEVDRYGPEVSPEFRRVTASLRDEDIAQEYNHSLDRSMKGLVYKEFNPRKHVPADTIAYDPSIPLLVGVDYGSTGWGAAVVGQVVGPWSLRVIADYELEGAGGAMAHAEHLANVLRGFGYDGPLGEVQVVGGPDTDTTQTGSGQTIAGYYRKVGFVRIRQARLRGPQSVDRGITVVCTSLRQDRVLVSPACSRLIERFGEYRWPMERGTNLVRGTAPLHNEASHIMDAFRYLVTEAFPTESAASFLSTKKPAREPERAPRLDVPPLGGRLDAPLMQFPERF